jgi:hypothetical protein
MFVLAKILKVIAVAVMMQGVLGVIRDPGSVEVLNDPELMELFGELQFLGSATVQSQYRSFAALWAGYGALAWWVSNDVSARRAPLDIMSVAIVLGGVGRLLTNGPLVFIFPWMLVMPALEIIVPLIFLDLFGRLARLGPEQEIQASNK